MNSTFHSALAGHGAGLITHIGLKNAAGVELSGGSYARKPVSWVNEGGTRRPTANLLFDIPAGGQVQSWCGFSALTGGVDYGGAVLDEPTPTYGSAGTYELFAAQTDFTVETGA